MASDDFTLKMGVDDGDFRAGISRMKSSIQGLTNEWKENEKAYKQVGDAQSAQKAKVDGLNSVLQKQKDMMKLLQDAQMDLGKRTKDNASQHDFLTKQMGKLGAEISKTNAAAQGQQRVLDSLTKATNEKRLADERLAKEEREMADTFKHSEDRLKYLNDTLKTNDDLTKANMNILDRAKNAQKSMQTHYDGLTNSIQKQQEIRKIELERLGRMRNMTDASSKAIDEQRLKVAQATDTLSKYQASLKIVNAEISKTNPFGSGAMVQGLNQTYRAYDKLESKMHQGFQNIKSGAISASIGIAGIGAVAVKGAEKASSLQNEYVKTLNLVQTGGEDAAEAVKNVNQMQKDGQKYSVEYGKSQKEIADGYQELIKRGYSSSSALGAMRSELEASVASGDDFNDVLSVASQVVDAYGMRSENTAKMISNTKEVVNNLAFAADMTATDFHSMGKAMEYVGDSSYNAGFKLSETSAAIGILSNHGLEADKAGTGLRKVINSITGALADANSAQESTNEKLAKYSDKIAKAQAKIQGYQEAVANGTKTQESANNAIKKQQQYIADLQDQAQSVADNKGDILSDLGIDPSKLVDANGNLRDLQTIMQEVNDKTKDMGTAQKNSVFNALFGTTGQQAGIILANNNKELGELNEKVAHAADGQGYVADLAKRNMGTVKQQIAQFKEAGEAAMILIGKQMLPVISEAAVKMSKFFNSKEGQKGLQTIAKGVAFVADKLIDLISFIGAHSDAVSKFAKTFAAIWAVNKVGKFLGMLKEVRTMMLELASINVMSGFGGVGGKASKAGKAASVASVGAEVASGAGTLGKVESSVAKSGILSKVGGGALKLTKGAGLLSLLSAFPELFSGSIGGRIGGFSGSLAGAGAGAATGAAIGSIIPGAGTAVGGILGAVGGGLGAFGGSKAGRAVGNEIQRVATGKEKLSATAPVKLTVGVASNIGKSLNKAIKGTKLDTLKTNVEVAINKGKVNKEMKKFSDDYQKSIKKLNKNSAIVVTTDKKKTKETQKAVNSAYDSMSKAILNHYANKTKAENKNFDTINKNIKLTDKQQKAYKKSLTSAQKADANREKNQQKILGKMRDNSDSYYKKVKKIQNGGTKELKKIEEKYGSSSVKYKKAVNKALEKAQKDHIKTQTSLEKKMNKSVEKETKISAGKQTDILSDLRKNKKKISLASAKEQIKTSKELRDNLVDDATQGAKKTISQANKKYKETTKAADEEYYVNKTISKKQYDEIVGKAKQQRDDAVKAAEDQKNKTVKHAEDTHRKVVDEATKQAGEHKGAIDGETGDVIGSWRGFVNNLNGVYNGMIDGINKVLNALHKGWGKIPKWDMKGYATGTKGLLADETALVGEEGYELAYHPTKGIHVLGKNGPEITDLKAGTSILPHDMSKQFMAMIDKMPAHKDGVAGTISDAWDWIKGTASSIGSSVEDVADKARDFIKDGAESVYNKLLNAAGFKPNMLGEGALQSIGDGWGEHIKDSAVDMLKGMFKKDEEDGGGSHGAPSGAGVERWRDQVKQALKANGLSTSTDMVNKVLRQIQTESGGNEKAVQGNIGDINNLTGNLAQGLMQVIPPTFAANAFPGHNNPFNGYDSLLAGLNYAKKRYGSDLSFLGQGHGYEHGGIITSHQIAELGEKGKREAVIPLDISERSRAIPLLKTAVNEMSNQTNSKPSGVVDTTQTSGTDLTEVLQNMQAILNGLNEVVMAVNTSLTPAKVTRAVNIQTQLNANLQSQMRGV